MSTVQIYLLCSFAVLLALAPVPADSANILGFLPNPGRSQFVVHDSLMRGLATNGHNVTVVSVYSPPATRIANYTYIQIKLDATLERSMEKSAKHVVQNTYSAYKMFEVFLQLNSLMAEVLSNPIVGQLKRTGQFDLVVLGYMMNSYQLGLAAHFRCPAVLITGTPVMLPLLDLVGNSLGASHATHQMISGAQPKTFAQRLENYLAWMGERVTFALLDRFLYEPTYRQHFPADRYPSLSEVKKNVSLVLVNSHISLGNPMALMPSMIEVSGIQVKKHPDPLPEDVASWLDGAGNGAIYFSFGSLAKTSEMTEEKIQVFLNVFARLKQRVLWKWEGAELTDKPENVMTGAWLPQDDILAHPNMKLFISHCGLGSVYEAKYHGVPILGLPLFSDQPANSRVIVQEGWSIELDFVRLSETTLSDGLHEMLTNDSYRSVVQQKAQLYKDRPAHPLDTAVWWVEYVIRHNGAKHMQCEAVHQNWVQFHSVDVIASILVIVCAQLFTGKVVVVFLWRKCVSSKEKS